MLPLAVLFVPLTAARWPLCVCLSFFVSDGAVSETKPEWIARGVFAADALTGASITGPSPYRRLRMQSLQNRNPSVIQWYGQKQL